MKTYDSDVLKYDQESSIANEIIEEYESEYNTSDIPSIEMDLRTNRSYFYDQIIKDEFDDIILSE